MKNISKKLNIAGLEISKDMEYKLDKFFGKDYVGLAFYKILGQKYLFQINFKERCIKASEDIWEYGFPNSIKELKEITDLYFRGELQKKELQILFYYLQNKIIPKGIIV